MRLQSLSYSSPQGVLVRGRVPWGCTWGYAIKHIALAMGWAHTQTWGEKGTSWGLQLGPTFPAVSHVPAPPPRSCSQASSQEQVWLQPGRQLLWAASCVQLTWPQWPRYGCHRAVTAAVTDCKAGERGASSPHWGLSCDTTTHELAVECCSNTLSLESCWVPLPKPTKDTKTEPHTLSFCSGTEKTLSSESTRSQCALQLLFLFKTYPLWSVSLRQQGNFDSRLQSKVGSLPTLLPPNP